MGSAAESVTAAIPPTVAAKHMATPPVLPARSPRPAPVVSQPVGKGSALFALTPVAVTTVTQDRAERLRVLGEIDQQEVKGCQKCELCRGRTHTVFGEGDVEAKLMFIGEGPGENEDLQGRPFCGRAGELLDKMILAVQFKREEVYIANTVKCRPPNNRPPTPGEIDACWGYLVRQIAVIQPTVIVTLGAPATKTLLQTTVGISALRGSWHSFTGLQPGGPAIPVMPTYHPAYLLRAYTPENRRKVWEDLKKAAALARGEG